MTELDAENIENILTEYLGGKFPIAMIAQKHFDGNNSKHLRKLVVTLKGKNAFGKDEIYIEAVAKLFPESKSSEDINYRKRAMKKEINFYKTVLPRLQEFQRQNNVEVFTACPEYIASRLNTNGTREIDSEAVLLLQDLEEEGYAQLGHHEGFDIDMTKMILEKVAEFHVIPVVMKQKKPMEFTRYVKDKCIFVEKSQKIAIEKIIDDVFWEKLYENNGCLPYISRLKQGLKAHGPPFPVKPTETFSTVIHNDLWMKNILVQHTNGKPSNVALLDFQEYIYGSPASDVLNILLTSSTCAVLDQHFNEMIKYYYTHLVKNLNKYHVDLEPFSWSKFLQEVKSAAVPALLKSIFFTLEVLYGGRNLGRLSVEEKQRIWLAIQQIGGNDWL